MQTIHEVATRVRQLRMELVAHQHTYYQTGTSPISDRHYDKLYEELSLLERHFPELQSTDSPTQIVGYSQPAGVEWVTYPSPMYSLDNTYDIDGIRHFIQRLGMEHAYYADAKLDGVATRLLYAEGQMTHALSRGDKQAGRNITRSAAIIRAIPVELSRNTTLDLIGEITADYATYQTINAIRRSQGRKTYASPRHATIGLLNSQVGEREMLRELTFTPHKIHGDPFSLGSHKRTIEALADIGFKVQTGVIFMGEDIHALQQFYGHLEAELQKGESVAADGIVVRLDDLLLSSRLGYTERAPRYAVAYKFPSPMHRACIDEIHYTVGRTGQISPLAFFRNAVPIAGLMVQQASLHSASNVLEKGYAPGVEVAITLGGSTIPSVTERLSPLGAEVMLPAACPSCGQSLTLRGRHLYCTHRLCKGVLHAHIRYATSRDALNLKGVGDALIRHLIHVGGVSSLPEVLTALESDSFLPGLSTNSRIACRRRLAEIKLALHQKESDATQRALRCLSLNELTPGLIRRMINAHPQWGLVQHLEFLSDQHALKAFGLTTKTVIALVSEMRAQASEISELLNYFTATTSPTPDDAIPI